MDAGTPQSVVPLAATIVRDYAASHPGQLTARGCKVGKCLHQHAPVERATARW